MKICTYLKSVCEIWLTVKGGAEVGVGEGGGLFKNQLPQGDAAVGLWDDLSLYLHIVLN